MRERPPVGVRIIPVVMVSPARQRRVLHADCPDTFTLDEGGKVITFPVLHNGNMPLIEIGTHGTTRNVPWEEDPRNPKR